MNLADSFAGYALLVLFALIGMCVGSFANVVCYRLPIIRKLGEFADGTKLKELEDRHGKYTLCSPRSACPCCDSQISLLHLTPVAGWLLLRGKCRSCGNRIGWTYPGTELIFGLAFAGYIAIEGVSLAGLLTLPMMLIAFSLLIIRTNTGSLVKPLIYLYVALLGLQILLSGFGYSAY